MRFRIESREIEKKYGAIRPDINLDRQSDDARPLIRAARPYSAHVAPTYSKPPPTQLNPSELLIGAKY